MNVLYLVGAPRVRIDEASNTPGPRTHVLGVVSALRQAGHNVEVFLASDERHAKSLRATEEEDLQVSRGRLVIGDLARLGIGFLNGRALRRFTDNYQLVYERYASYQALGRRLKRQQPGCVWVLESNGLFFKEATGERKSIGLRWLARQQELRAYRSADLVVAVSDRIKQELVSEAFLSLNHVVVVPNGFDFARLRMIEPRRMFALEDTVVTFVGQVVEWQGLSHLLDVLPSLSRRIKVVIVGDGPALPNLKSQVATAGLTDRVHFTGRLPYSDAMNVVAGGDIGFAGHVPKEGDMTYHSPLKVYEYLALGLPVVSTRSNATEDAYRPSTIHHFVSGDNAQLREAILAASSHDRSQTARGQRSSDAEEHISWNSRVRQILQAAGLSD